MKKQQNIIITIVLAICFTVSALPAFGQNHGGKRVIGLNELFELADSSHQAIKSYEASVRVADDAVRVSKNALLPDINFTASASYIGDAWMADRDFSDGQTLDTPHFGNNFALEVSQVVFAGGAIINNIKATQLQSDLARLDLQAQRTKVRFLLTGYYLNLYKFKNMVIVYKENINRTQQVIKDMKARVSQGLALDNDITRYEVQLQNLLYKRTELLGSIDICNNQLVTSLDLPADTQIVPDSTLLNADTDRYTENDLQLLASENSPILKIADTNIDLSKKRVKITEAGLWPKVKIMGGDYLQGPITFEVPVIDQNLNTWYVGLGLSYDIGSLYKSSKEISKSKHAVQHAQVKYKKTKDNVTMRVHKAYVHYLNAFELHQTQEKSLELATENYDITENRYKNDLVLLIDLLDADNLRLDAQIQYENAKINILYNYYKLMYVTGTL